jgi:methanogenic corrinoid protein MtbC1
VNDLTHEFREALESLDRLRCLAIFQRACESRAPLAAAEELITPALCAVGEAWDAGHLALAQVYMSSRICEDLVERMLPLFSPERKSQPPIALAVLSDYHFLGKRIVLSVMRASGFDVLDYGHMDTEELVARVAADGVEILLISVLMLPSALKVKAVREALDAAGKTVHIAVGGAPFLFDPELWSEVGADAMGRSATDAVAIVRGWMESPA